jgi:hypothetical protein
MSLSKEALANLAKHIDTRLPLSDDVTGIVIDVVADEVFDGATKIVFADCEFRMGSGATLTDDIYDAIAAGRKIHLYKNAKRWTCAEVA